MGEVPLYSTFRFSYSRHPCTRDFHVYSPSRRSCLYRGTWLIRNTPLLGTYNRTMSTVLWWSWGGGLFLMSEVPL